MSLFKLNDPTLISASALEALVQAGQLVGPARALPMFLEADLVAAGITAGRFANANIAFQGNPSGFSPALNTLYAVPAIFNRPANIIKCGFNLVANATAGGQARFGIYLADPITKLPTTLLFDSGVVATDSGAAIFRVATLPSPIPVTANTLLYGVSTFGTAAPTITSSTGSIVVDMLGGVAEVGFQASLAFGALPASYPATFNVSGATAPLIAYVLG